MRANLLTPLSTGSSGQLRSPTGVGYVGLADSNHHAGHTFPHHNLSMLSFRCVAYHAIPYASTVALAIRPSYAFTPTGQFHTLARFLDGLGVPFLVRCHLGNS